MRVRALPALGGALTCALALSMAGPPASAEPGPTTQAMIVETTSGLPPAFAGPGAGRVRSVRELGGGFFAVALTQPMTPATAAERLRRANAHARGAGDADLASVTPDVRIALAAEFPGTPEPMSDQQWDIWDTAAVAGGYSVRAPAAWPSTTGDPDIIVAVIDTGITAHPDLAGQTVPGYDFISDPSAARDDDSWDPDPTDEGDWALPLSGCATTSSWHGTHVTGTIVARADSVGVVGVAPGVRVQPVRVLGSCGGSLSDLVAAIRWAAGDDLGVPVNPTPAAVINLSLGAAGSCPRALASAIAYATSHDVDVVVAAGNEGSDVAASMPANCPGAIAVAATGRAGQRAGYSNTGSGVDIAAPGGTDGQLVWSTSNTGVTRPGEPGYRAGQGTSMAAPHVAAALALVRSARPELDAGQAWSLLAANARPFPEATGLDCTRALCGAGIVDLVGLLPEPAGGLAIGGHVRRGGTGVADVEVSVFPHHDPAPGRYARTDPEGGYRVDGLAPGEYDIRFSQGPAVAWSATVEVPDTASDVDQDWPELGSVSGTVIAAEDGQPIAGAAVGLAGGHGEELFRTVSTDALGNFRFPALWAGEYRIRADAAGTATRGTWVGGPSYAAATRFTVADGAPVTGLGLTLARPQSSTQAGIASATPTPASDPTPAAQVGPDPPPAVPAPPAPMLGARARGHALPGVPRVRLTPRTAITLTASVPVGVGGTVEFSDSAGALATAAIVGGVARAHVHLRGGRQQVTARIVGPPASAASEAVSVRVVDRAAPRLTVRWRDRATGSVAIRARDAGGVAAVLVRSRAAGRWTPWTSLPATTTDWAPASWDRGICLAVSARDWAGHRSRTVRRCW